MVTVNRADPVGRSGGPVTSGWTACALVVGANALLFLVVVGLDLRGVDHWLLVRDANAVAGQPGWVGAHSSLGILAWVVGAAVALFAGTQPGARHRTILIALGGYMALAGADDLFMLHEAAGAAWGLEKPILGLFGLGFLGVVALVARGGAWRGTPWPLLAASAGGLGLSVGVDVVPGQRPGQVLLEETLKVAGATCLAGFAVLLARWSLGGRG